MDKKLLPKTRERAQRLLAEWRIVREAVGRMVAIYSEEDSETPQYIDDCIVWPPGVIPMSLDEWEAEIASMIDKVENSLLKDIVPE